MKIYYLILFFWGFSNLLADKIRVRMEPGMGKFHTFMQQTSKEDYSMEIENQISSFRFDPWNPNRRFFSMGLTYVLENKWGGNFLASYYSRLSPGGSYRTTGLQKWFFYEEYSLQGNSNSAVSLTHNFRFQES